MVSETSGTRRAARDSRAWRSVLAGIAAITTLAIVAGLAACGSSSSDSEGAGATNGEKSVVVFGTELAPFMSLDPDQEGAYTSITANVYDTLTGYDSATGKVTPQLATRWESSPDGKTWTFHLREGVKFHDGSILDSAAVKFSLERSMTSGITTYIWKPVKSVEAPDKYTVVLNLKYPAAIDMVTAASFGAWINSPAAFEKYGDKVFSAGCDAGSGPYTIKSASLTEVVLERFPDYWGGWEDTHAKAPDLGVVRQMSEPAVRVQNLEQGVAQVIQSASFSDLPRLLDNPSLKLYNMPGWIGLDFIMNTSREPLSDIHLREALCYAYPYQQAVDLAYGGYASLSHGSIPPGIPGYEEQNARFPAPAQDMAKARAALAKSAYPNGDVTIKLHVVQGDDKAAKACQLFKAALSELNIDLSVKSVSTSVIYTQAQPPDAPQDIMCTQWMCSYPSPQDIAVNMFTNPPPEEEWTNDFSYFSSPQTDEMFDQAEELLATDQEAGIELLLDCWEIIEAQKTTIFSANLESTPVASTSLKGFAGFPPEFQATVLFYDVWLEE